MSSCKILLMTQLLVRGDEQVVVALFGSVEQVPVAKVGPTHLEGRVHRVLDQMTPQGSRDALVEQDPQESITFAKDSTSWVRTASTFRPSTPVNHSRNWATVAPSLGFSNKADTGTRVPRHTQAPLSLFRVPFNCSTLVPVCHDIALLMWLSGQPRRGVYPISNLLNYRVPATDLSDGFVRTCLQTFSSQEGWWLRQRLW